MYKFLAMGSSEPFTGVRDVLAEQTFESKVEGLKWASQIEGVREIEWECSDGIWRQIGLKGRYQVIYYEVTAAGVVVETSKRSGADLVADLLADRRAGDIIGFTPVEDYEEF